MSCFGVLGQKRGPQNHLFCERIIFGYREPLNTEVIKHPVFTVFGRLLGSRRKWS